MTTAPLHSLRAAQTTATAGQQHSTQHHGSRAPVECELLCASCIYTPSHSAAGGRPSKQTLRPTPSSRARDLRP